MSDEQGKVIYPDYPKQQASINGPYHNLSDFDLLRVFVRCLNSADFIGDIRSKVDDMANDQFHKIDMTAEFGDLEAACDEATYRVWLHDYRARKDSQS